MTDIERLKSLNIPKECEMYGTIQRAIKALEKENILDKIREEITNIEVYGQINEYTGFVRTNEQIKSIVLEIIDKYRESEE